MEHENPYSRRTDLERRTIEVYEIKTGRVIARFQWQGGRDQKLQAKAMAMELVAQSWVTVTTS